MIPFANLAGFGQRQMELQEPDPFAQQGVGGLVGQINQGQIDAINALANSGLVRHRGLRDSDKNMQRISLDDMARNQSPTDRYQRMWGNQQQQIQDVANNLPSFVRERQAERNAANLEGSFVDPQGRRVVMGPDGTPVGFSGAAVGDFMGPDQQLATGSGIPMAAGEAFGQGTGPQTVDRSSATSLDAQDARMAAIQQISQQLLQGAQPADQQYLRENSPQTGIDTRFSVADLPPIQGQGQGQGQPGQAFTDQATAGEIPEFPNDAPTPSAFPGGGSVGEQLGRRAGSTAEEAGRSVVQARDSVVDFLDQFSQGLLGTNIRTPVGDNPQEWTPAQDLVGVDNMVKARGGLPAIPGDVPNAQPLPSVERTPEQIYGPAYNQTTPTQTPAQAASVQAAQQMLEQLGMQPRQVDPLTQITQGNPGVPAGVAPLPSQEEILQQMMEQFNAQDILELRQLLGEFSQPSAGVYPVQ
jgi:hypothetical protein